MYAMKINRPPKIREDRQQPSSGACEDSCLRSVLLEGRGQRLQDRVAGFGEFLESTASFSKQLYMRKVISVADREVEVIDPFTGEPMKMLMFGSNNYLGLANHPYVKERVARAITDIGVGVGGPPLLNGYTGLHRQLEERIADFKKTEDSILFPTGYSANLGMLAGLTQAGDTILHDALSHASFRDGLRLTGASHQQFRHNDLDDLRRLLDRHRPEANEMFVGVEGVYSMDGDLAPLDEIVAICRRNRAVLMVDDAHGTGVMGPSGRGTASHFGVEDDIDVTMGTFSKVFSTTGGFVASSKPIIDYLRFFARSHMFSAAISPMVVMAVLAGFDVMESEPERLEQLRANIRYACSHLNEAGAGLACESPILTLRVPVGADLFESAHRLHEAGLFVNAVVYPAVPAHEQRFRISLMATHTRDDLDRLITCVSALLDDWRRQGENDHESESDPHST